MREPTWTEIDGVPVVWLPVPGPLRAVLSFRVGMADETAPRRGVTHLVEHLALHGMHDRPYAINGVVDLTRTAFFASGRPEEVVEFLGTVCARLGDLPADRVETERGVLRAESGTRSSGYFGTLLYWRYGAQAHGLPGMSEYGLTWLDAPTVRWWAEQRFTRQNAILALTGEPPPGLRLPLADGVEHPPLRAEPVESVIPGWAAVPAGGMALGAVLSRAPGAAFAAQVAETELSRVLRFERGITYSVGYDYDPLDADRAHLVLSADAADERHPQLRDGFLEVLERLVDHGPEPAALAMVRDRRTRVDDEALALGSLDWVAREFVLGRPYEPPAVVRARSDAVTDEEVAASLREIAETALYVVPAPLELPAPRYPALPVWSPDTVVGDVYRGRDGASSLVVGPDGVSVVTSAGAVTVRWADTTAALWWETGARSVIGRDGFRAVVVPADWANGAEAVARIDAAVPRQAMVPMPGDGPDPTLPDAGPAPVRPVSRRWRWVATAIGYVMALAMFLVAAEGPQPATGGTPAVTEEDVLQTFVLGTIALVGAVWSTVSLWLGRKQAPAPR